MRYVSTDKLVDAVRRVLSGDEGSDAEPRIAEKAIREYMRRMPSSPKLVSRKAAAGILGVQLSHLGRLEGRLPKPVVIEGGRDAFHKAEVVALAKVLKQEKKARQQRREKP